MSDLTAGQHPLTVKAAHITATACMCGPTTDAATWCAMLATFAYLGTEIREDVREDG